MIRKVALFAACCLLTSCATPSSLPPAEIPAVAPKAVDPAICADLAPEPRMPDGASIPAPFGLLELEASEAFLGWTQAVLDWGRVNFARATKAKAASCG